MRRIALVGLALFAATGCTVEGEAGVLSFIGEDGLIDAWKDMAVGTQVRVHVYDANYETPSDDTEAEGSAADVVVLDASVDNSTVAAVASFEDNDVLLDVTGVGDAFLSVSADIGDDRVAFEAREPVVVLDADSQGEALDPLTMVAGGQVTVPYLLEDAAGNSLLGSGLDGFTLSEGAVGELRSLTASAAVVVELTEPGSAEVGHALATGTRSVTAVALSEVASLDLNAEVMGGDAPLSEGATLTTDDAILLLPEAALADGTLVSGAASLIEVSIEDETVCSAEAGEILGIELTIVSLDAPGTCSLTATLGELSDGFSVEVGD